jgi:beta-fructofuranosidase
MKRQDPLPLPNVPNQPSDPHRPAFHFLPARNWMNDPNGLIQWRGQYHLFYQYNPHGAFHGTIHWGHAVSADLVHWTELPVALAPTPGGPDAGGCWSGCAVDDGGVPTFIYTGVHPQTVCLALGAEDTLTWRKHPANPVIAAPPAELAAASEGHFRDPFVWQADGQWHMVIGSKAVGQGGLVLRYRSADLVHWEYAGVLLRGDIRQTEPFSTGAMWECPNFFALGGQHVLIVSVQSEHGELLYPAYFAGAFDGEHFTPSVQRLLVHGATFYAPQVLRLADGRTVMWGWLKEGRDEAAARAAGWSGVMSVPIVLAWLPEGKLGLAPAEELKALRREHWHFDDLSLEPGTAEVLPNVKGDCLEIEAVFEPEPGAEFGLALRCPAEGKAEARLTYDCANERLKIEPGSSSAPLPLDTHGQLRLRVFLDRSVLEVFANDHTCLAARLYPERADSLGLALFCRAGRVRLKTLDVWTMASIW